MRVQRLEVACNLVGEHHARYSVQQGNGAPAAQDTASNVSSDQSLVPIYAHEQTQLVSDPALGKNAGKTQSIFM